MSSLNTNFRFHPNTRRQIRRVKSGCNTCKLRRVKCGEERPSCWRCLLAGRTCAGYGVWGSSGDAHYNSHNIRSLYICRPMTLGTLDSLGIEDRSILEWFRTSQIQGVFPFPFWEVLVPQAYHSEPAILSCVLALGSIHQKACISTATVNHHGEVERLEATSLRHYNTAMRLLRTLRPDGGKNSTRVILIACLTFIIIEYLQRDPAPGLIHLRHGLQILSDTYPKESQRDAVDEWLLEAFARLEVQARLMFYTAARCQFLTTAEPCRERIPKLGLLHEARKELDVLLFRADQLRLAACIAESSGNVRQLFQELSTQQQLKGDLQTWSRAYRTWRCSESSSIQEKVAQHLLSAYHSMASIMVSTALHPGDESVFDRHMSEFDLIMASATNILQMYEPVLARSTSLRRPHCTRAFTFTSDLGLIPVLYYTAIKCRDLQIRQDAVSMLEAQVHQEGLWHGQTAALIASEVIRLEGTPPLAACDQQDSAHISIQGNHRASCCPVISPDPKSWRFSDVQIELTGSPKQCLMLRCSRKSRNGTWVYVVRRHDGTRWY